MMFRGLPHLLLQMFIVVAASISLAHAADGPGLLDSISKLLTPSRVGSAPAASNRTLAVTATGQGRRIALVIGNGDYQHTDNLPKLGNPAHDAEDIAEALRGFGFEVIERKNQTLEAMSDTIAEFGSKIGGSEAALFYFAGHGIQVNNQNFLMPVNARIASESSVPYQGINVNQILDEMDKGKSAANIVMLDACRNNPISGKFRSGKSRGLASPGSVPRGTVIVYATDPGNTAADGDGRNGLFTAGLLTAFKGKDLSLDDVLTVASAEVERASGNTQTPYVNGPQTLKKNFHFRVTVDPGKGEIEKTFWTSIERSNDSADFEAYLRKYPNGSYRALAENQIKRLKVSQEASPVPFEAPNKTTPASQASATSVTGGDTETQFWNEVKTGGTREYLDAYLKQYPKGKYVALAKVELKKIEGSEKAQRAKEEADKQLATERERLDAMHAEQAAWDDAKAGTSEAAFESYLQRYPKGRYATLATIAKQKMQREAAERKKQDSARREQEERRADVARQRQQAEADAAERGRQEAAEKAAERKEQKPTRLTHDKTMTIVNGQVIPKMVEQALLDGQIAQEQKDTPELRKAIKEELVRRMVLTQEAVKKGMGQPPNTGTMRTSVDGQSFLAQQAVLIGAYLNEYVKTHPITDDQIKKEYAEISAKLGNKEYKARHILVEKEDEAKAIIAKLTKGEKIEDLAKDSKDPGSKDRGGDLGWANPASFLPPFSAAMIKLEKGKFTETPVKSDFGWHVIQLEDTRELKLPGIEEAKAQIGQQLTQRMVQKHIDELRAKAKVE